MNMEIMISSGISHTQSDKYYIFSLIFGIRRKKKMSAKGELTVVKRSIMYRGRKIKMG
jgi:hypothetical protein